MATPKNWINGAFLNKVEGYEMINMDLTQAAIDQINNIKPNSKGMRKFTLGPQQKDPSKYSLWENEFKPKSETVNAGNSGNDLPF